MLALTSERIATFVPLGEIHSKLATTSVSSQELPCLSHHVLGICSIRNMNVFLLHKGDHFALELQLGTEVLHMSIPFGPCSCPNSTVKCLSVNQLIFIIKQCHKTAHASCNPVRACVVDPLQTSVHEWSLPPYLMQADSQTPITILDACPFYTPDETFMLLGSDGRLYPLTSTVAEELSQDSIQAHLSALPLRYRVHSIAPYLHGHLLCLGDLPSESSLTSPTTSDWPNIAQTNLPLTLFVLTPNGTIDNTRFMVLDQAHEIRQSLAQLVALSPSCPTTEQQTSSFCGSLQIHVADSVQFLIQPLLPFNPVQQQNPTVSSPPLPPCVLLMNLGDWPGRLSSSGRSRFIHEGKLWDSRWEEAQHQIQPSQVGLIPLCVSICAPARDRVAGGGGAGLDSPIDYPGACDLCFDDIPFGSSSSITKVDRGVTLACGHVFHHGCVAECLARARDYEPKGQRIHFTLARCPSGCGSLICSMAFPECPGLAKLFAATLCKVAMRSELEFPSEMPREAMVHYLMYICSHCRQPFWGGNKECAAMMAGEPVIQPNRLVCENCRLRHVSQYGASPPSAPDGTVQFFSCPLHQRQAVVYKCLYCCHPATHLSLGIRRLCERCVADKHNRPLVPIPLTETGGGWCEAAEAGCLGEAHCPCWGLLGTCLGVSHGPTPMANDGPLPMIEYPTGEMVLGCLYCLGNNMDLTKMVQPEHEMDV